jgi:cytochrome P450
MFCVATLHYTSPTGGADTTVSAEYAFFLAMVLHPGMPRNGIMALPEITLHTSDVQKKAQAEIDTVVGNDRLPTFADRANLPYVNALVSEVFRWNSVLPIGKVQ